MGHHALRHDNECQNCGYTVDVAYCSKCGQQNTETRQSFHHLLTHFAEDLTHYDGAFWKTIKYLLFRPGRLTIEYLEGHRMRYVPPVKLYIFISFVTFFLMAVMAPENEEHINTEKSAEKHEVISIGTDAVQVSKVEYQKLANYNGINYTTVKQFDSIHKITPDALKFPTIVYHLKKASLLYNEHNPASKDIVIAIAHTVPKVLFIYMPVFAFWLWMVHGKKRWYFFDHGIFTLHYFSLLLLLITIIFLIDWVLSFIPYDQLTDIILGCVVSLSFLYPVFYFFRSHSRFYGERKAVSRLKSILLFFLNFICFMVIFAITYVYIAYNMH